ncbi:hypothetical protein ZWY2020_002020 [Hordeum vulgare]|nr:hypothetical protein ZWY2020_002020 [Hordeum vulgare]
MRRNSLGVLLLELLNRKSLKRASLQEGDCGTLDLPRLVHSMVRVEWTAEMFGVELVRLGVMPRRRWSCNCRHRRSYGIARRWPSSTSAPHTFMPPTARCPDDLSAHSYTTVLIS